VTGRELSVGELVERAEAKVFALLRVAFELEITAAISKKMEKQLETTIG